jgi:hypothetical protein
MKPSFIRRLIHEIATKQLAFALAEAEGMLNIT